MMIEIREERAQDIGRIAAVTERAFRDAPHSSHTEPLIVDALRAAGKLTLSLVAVDGDQIVGHLALSPVILSSGETGWQGLGPISVQPDRQGRGIGTRLMQAALQWLRISGAAGCVVLGDLRYYTRFGFSVFPQLVLPGVPPEYFMALPCAGKVPQADVAYDAAFEATP